MLLISRQVQFLRMFSQRMLLECVFSERTAKGDAVDCKAWGQFGHLERLSQRQAAGR